VTCLSWEPFTKEENNLRFVSGGNDHKLKIWTINKQRQNPEKIFNLEGHVEAITDVVWFNSSSGASTIVSSGKVALV
jgi:WD40 repeat protein